jgi:hypothetical protein
MLSFRTVFQTHALYRRVDILHIPDLILIAYELFPLLGLARIMEGTINLSICSHNLWIFTM